MTHPSNNEVFVGHFKGFFCLHKGSLWLLLCLSDVKYSSVDMLTLTMRKWDPWISVTEQYFSPQPDGDKPIRNFLDDPRRSGPVLDTDRKEGSRRHVRNWGGLDFDSVKTGTDLEKEWTVSHERNVH